MTEAFEEAERTQERELEFVDDEGSAAVEWQQLPPEREFFATPYDPPVKTLVQEIQEKDLNVRPSFQRYAVWDVGRQSKFVESLLLNIPIPTLFFAEDDDKTKVVVDGQQRLLAIKEFLEDRYALSGLEVLAPLNGKRFHELTGRQQRLLRNRTVRCLVISARSDSEIRFQVFERLNQGGIPLNAQEVRHCVYRGSFNDLLHRLVDKNLFQQLLGLNERHPRMNDCELALRFFAIRSALPNYSPPLKTLLNSCMRRMRYATPEQCLELERSFELAIRAVAAVFSDLPFRRVFRLQDGKIAADRSLNRAVFDAQMIVMEGLDTEWASDNREAIKVAFTSLCLEDQVFADSVSRATADKARMDYRLRRWRDVLLQLGGVLPAEGRIP
jgi:hypothetical protein